MHVHSKVAIAVMAAVFLVLLTLTPLTAQDTAPIPEVVYLQSKNEHDDLYIAFADGSVIRNLTQGQKHAIGDYTWSSDGRYLAIEVSMSEDDQMWGISVYDAATEKLTDVSSGETYEHDPSWHENTIAFIRESPEGNAVWTYSLESHRFKRISNYYVFAAHPAWNGDGAEIAFMCSSSYWGQISSDMPNEMEICLTNLETGEDRFLTENAFPDANPFWMDTEFAWITQYSATQVILTTQKAILYIGDLDVEDVPLYKDGFILFSEAHRGAQNGWDRQVTVLWLNSLNSMALPTDAYVDDAANADISSDSRYFAYQTYSQRLSTIRVWDVITKRTTTIATTTAGGDYLFRPVWQPRS